MSSNCVEADTSVISVRILNVFFIFFYVRYIPLSSKLVFIDYSVSKLYHIFLKAKSLLQMPASISVSLLKVILWTNA